MTTPELPPLPRFDFDIYAGGDVEDANGVFVRFADVEARERILLARIAELECLWQAAETRYAEADAAAMSHAKSTPRRGERHD